MSAKPKDLGKKILRFSAAREKQTKASMSHPCVPLLYTYVFIQELQVRFEKYSFDFRIK